MIRGGGHDEGVLSRGEGGTTIATTGGSWVGCGMGGVCDQWTYTGGSWVGCGMGGVRDQWTYTGGSWVGRGRRAVCVPALR